MTMRLLAMCLVMFAAGISPIFHAVVTVRRQPVEPAIRRRIVPPRVVFVVRSDIENAETLAHRHINMLVH